MAALFLRYSSAFIGLHLLGTSLLQHVDKGSMTVVASGKLKNATLYLSGIIYLGPSFL